METNLPAKRYDLFIKAFEKEVEKAQEKIKAMDRLMRPYEICRAALEKADLKNETKLELRDDGIRIVIVPLQDDQKDFYAEVMSSLKSDLVAAKLHPTGIPADGETSFDFFHYWNLHGFSSRPPRIEIRIDVPISGTDYIEIWKGPERVQTYTERDQKPIWLDKPRANKETDLGGADDIPF